jgi:hypothetical protein
MTEEVFDQKVQRLKEDSYANKRVLIDEYLPHDRSIAQMLNTTGMALPYLLLEGGIMKTSLLDGEQLVRQFDGILCETESEGTCYITNRRLIFEEPDREVKPEVKINWKKLAKRSVIGGVFGGGLGGGLGGASSVDVKPGSKTEGPVSVFWFYRLTGIELAEMKIGLRPRKKGGETEQALFRVREAEERLTKEDQERIKALVETAKDEAGRQRERQSSIEEKLSFLKERNTKEGYLNPEAKLESDISRKMGSGKTRERAIEELFEEAD